MAMKNHVRNEALRAAAKVAFGALFTGCGGGVEAGNVVLDAAPSTDARVADGSHAGDAETDAAATDDASSPPFDAAAACAITTDADGGLSAASQTCCLALTTANAPQPGSPPVPGGPWGGIPALSSCCAALSAAAPLTTYEYGPPMWSPQACQACADTLGQPAACTPWGPPMPPAMPRARLEVA